MRQQKHTILRNFPVLGHLRYLLEGLRPEIRQYFIEGDNDSVPFSRSQRSIVYQRAKLQADNQPFGTRRNVYAEGYEWIKHSIYPTHLHKSNGRYLVGGPHCKQKYSASILNISAMSYGAISANAVLALNGGAKLGDFYHNTGEGGVSRYHLEPGGDIVWNIGTGYFGCRDEAGAFSPERFVQTASKPQIKMIEVKLSQVKHRLYHGERVCSRCPLTSSETIALVYLCVITMKAFDLAIDLSSCLDVVVLRGSWHPADDSASL